VQGPGRELALLDGLEQVLAVVVAIRAGERVGVALREEVDALLGLEVELDPEALARGVDEHVGVRAE
jgi:hypothetical protein